MAEICKGSCQQRWRKSCSNAPKRTWTKWGI